MINKMIILFLLSGIVIDVFVLKKSYDLITIFLIILWIIIIKLKTTKLLSNEEYSFTFGIAFLFFSLLLSLIGKNLLADKTSSWAYIFLLTGFIQKFFKK